MNIGILLAAGQSSRFQGSTPKQLYPINGKPMICHSIDILTRFLDELVIVTNSACYEQVCKLTRHAVLMNDVDCRLQSIRVALEHIDKQKSANILIHDAARPFITSSHVTELLSRTDTYQYAQYCLKLTNGLLKKKKSNYELVNRDQFVELCTPQIVDYKTLTLAFKNHITPKNCEILPFAKLLQIKYDLIEGHYKHLRKITTLDDL